MLKVCILLVLTCSPPPPREPTIQYGVSVRHRQQQTRADFLTINGTGTGKNVAFALTGTNTFTYATQAGGTLQGPDATLGLFFASTATPYNPTGAGSARTPDLAVYVASGGTATFMRPAAGIALNNYAYQGSSTANGATAFTANGSYRLP